jgi:Flp pilus assembly protein TadD
LMYRQGNVQGAIRELEALAELTPNDLGVHLNMGAMLASAGEPQRALEHFRKAAILDPGNPHALNGMSQARKMLR